jgi:hypothetical protein
VTDDFPANISDFAEFVAIAASLVRTAMCAAPIVNGFVPNAFVNTTLYREPPMLVWTISRKVWLEMD